MISIEVRVNDEIVQEVTITKRGCPNVGDKDPQKYRVMVNYPIREEGDIKPTGRIIPKPCYVEHQRSDGLSMLLLKAFAAIIGATPIETKKK